MHDAWIVWLAVGAVVLLVSLVLVLASRSRRLGSAALALLVLSALVWGADLWAISSGFRDADGFVDCGRSCTGTQRLSAVAFLVAPLLFTLGGLALLLSAARRRRRPSRP